MRIVFAGTPALAVPTLEALIRSRNEVALVITQPDRPAGRGRKSHMPPVKEMALAKSVPVIQPESINRPDVLQQLRAIEPDAIIVIAYGKRLGRRVLALPQFGCLNIHFSLLPKYRGASPINHAILNGEQETGLTIQRMAAEIDTGPILFQHRLEIGAQETAGELAERLAALSSEKIVPALEAIESGAVEEHSQNPANASKAPLLRKSDGAIRWKKRAAEICNFVRGMTPWPGAFTFVRTASGETRGRLIILSAHALAEAGLEAKHAIGEVARPGIIVRADSKLVVAAGEDFVSVERVQPEGGKPMDANAYLRGHSVRVGDRFRERV